MIKVSTIKRNKNNPREIKDANFEKLKNSIRDFPQMMALRPIIVDAGDVTLGGNMRLAAIKALGMKEIPDDWVKRADDLTDEQKKEFIVKDNVGFGAWDWDALANENWDELPLSDWGLELPTDWAEVETVEQEAEAEVAETISKAKELQAKWQTATGQLWKLGEHRLLIADATKKDNIERLFGNKSASFVFADPPYGIEIVNADRAAVDGAKPFGKVGFGEKGKNKIIDCNIYSPIIGDETTETAIDSYLLVANLLPQAVHIWWGGNYYANALPPSSCWIVWDKENTGNFADAELAWTNQKTAVRIFKHQWNGLIKESERGEKRVHPTQKPVALAVWCFEKYGKDGDLIFDPFLGSGISIIAAEKINRKVYGMELSPEYVAVTLERWANLTGKSPELIETSEAANG